MASRSFPVEIKCTHPGCGSVSRYNFSSQRAWRESYERRKMDTHKCVIHAKWEETLRADNLERETTLVCIETGSGRYWKPEGSDYAESGGNGFAHGNGYKVYADWFPAGTKLKVVAKIVLPNVAEVEAATIEKWDGQHYVLR